MVNNLLIQSIDTDNQVTVMFSDRQLPRIARHGELYVVNGILYTYADIEGTNQGKWFPLTDKKEFYHYSTEEVSAVWVMNTVFHTDNIQVVIYDQDGRIYPWDHTLSVDDETITVYLEKPSSGSAYIITNEHYSWIDDKIVVGNKNFVILPNPENEDEVYIEIDTEYLEILKSGITTFRSDVTFEANVFFNGDLNIDGNVAVGGDVTVQGTTDFVDKLTVVADIQTNTNLTVDGDSLVKGNSVVDGNLTVRGMTTTVDTEEIKLSDNIITLNSNSTGTPTENAGIEVTRGDELTKTIVQWDEVNDVTNIPNNTVIDGLTTVKSNVTLEGNLQVDGSTNIDGNLTVQGENVSISTQTLNVEDNIITINKGSTGVPVIDVGFEFERGDEGTLSLLIFNETDDFVTIPVKQLNGSFLQDEVSGKIYTLDEIDKEKARAVTTETTLSNRVTVLETDLPATEADLQNQINNEITNRTNADTTLQTNIDTEETRATTSEDALRSSLNDETSAREVADTLLNAGLTSETTDRLNADAVLNASLNTEKSRAETVELGLQTSLTTEVNRAKSVEGDLATLTTADKTSLVNALNEEIVRAENNESTLSTLITNETATRILDDTTLQNNIDSEEATRIADDETLQNNIDAEEISRTTVDATLQNNIDSEETRAITAEATIDGKFVDYVSNTQTTIQEIQSDLTLNENVIVKKDLTVQGTTVTVNATSVEVDDNKFILNSTVITEVPTQDALLIVSRGVEGLTDIIKWYENGDDSEVQISEWDTNISQFVVRQAATRHYVDSEVGSVNSALNVRVTVLENDPTTDNLINALTTEISRAQNAEGDLTQLTTSIKTNLVGALNSEVDRAKAATTALTGVVTTEINRSVAKDAELELELDNEVARAVAKDSEIEGNLSDEITRATSVEGDLSNLTTVSRSNLTNSINSLKIEVDTNAISASDALSEMFVKDGTDIVFKGNLIPESDSSLTIGSTDKKIKEVHISANTIYLGEQTTISETGFHLNGTLTATVLNVGNLEADNMYDSGQVDNRLSLLEANFNTSIIEVESTHQTLSDKVDTESLSKTSIDQQNVVGEVSFGGNVVFQQDLVILGTETVINVVTYNVENHEIIMNDGMGENVPYLDSRISVNRGIEGILPILTWKELGVNSHVTIPYVNENDDIVQGRIVTENKLTDTIADAVSGITTSVDDETVRAETAETTLDTKITDEISRAQTVEGLLSGLSTKLQDGEGVLPPNLVIAINRAVTKSSVADTNLTTAIDNEVSRTTGLVNDVTTLINNEVTRAQSKETVIEAGITAEEDRATATEALLTTAVNNEKTRAQTKENELTLGLSNEVSRATTTETDLQDQIDVINDNMSTDAEREAAVQSLTTSLNTTASQLNATINVLETSTTTNLNNEIVRAQSIESVITSNLNNEIARAKDVEGQLIALDTVVQTNLVSAINEVHNDVDTEAARAQTVEGPLNTLDTAVQTNLVSAINEVHNDVDTEAARAQTVEGPLNTLDTAVQTNLVLAINEVHTDVDAVGTMEDFLEGFTF